MENIPIQIENQRIAFLPRMYFWQAVGLLISGLLALRLSQSFNILGFIMSHQLLILAFAIIQLVVVLWLSFEFDKITSPKISLQYIGYSAFNGVSVSIIFLYFTQNTITNTFFILAGMFLILAIFTHFVRVNFTKWINFILLAFFGTLLNIYVNMIWRYDLFQLITTSIAIVIFMGILAFDYARIEEFEKSNEENSPIKGAFAMYLNLYFLFIAVVMAANTRQKRIS